MQSPNNRELTWRALLSGLVLGAVLTPCNVYSGLKIGWSFNMSITALLLAYAFWRPLSRLLGLASWERYESNITQTSASSAASIISGGLVAPLPALALISGDNLPLPQLIAWVMSVSLLGVWVAWYLRPRFIIDSDLTFPAGVATAETLQDIFSTGRAAMQRVIALLSSLALAVGVRIVDQAVWQIPRWSPSAGLQKLTFSFDPSFLLFGFGAIIGPRAGASLLIGALIAWGALAPISIDYAWVASTELQGESWFQPLVAWLLWPGVSLMVASSLTSLLLKILSQSRTRQERDKSDRSHHEGRRWRLLGLSITAIVTVILQIQFFDIHWTMAIVAIPMAFVLATVAARVAGETGIPPIGAIGKVSQLSFGVMAPQQPVTNLMTANVAGGAAGQCADLLNDFKAGHLIGASALAQIWAQFLGIITGAIVGSWIYLKLIPDPANQLLTTEWPAPAVATWKAVAEALGAGLSALSASTLAAMAIASSVGAVLAVAEHYSPKSLKVWVPSGVSMGLAFVVPASVSITLFLGAATAAVIALFAKSWSARFSLSIAAGFIAGESIFGVVNALIAG